VPHDGSPVAAVLERRQKQTRNTPQFLPMRRRTSCRRAALSQKKSRERAYFTVYYYPMMRHHYAVMVSLLLMPLAHTPVAPQSALSATWCPPLAIIPCRSLGARRDGRCLSSFVRKHRPLHTIRVLPNEYLARHVLICGGHLFRRFRFISQHFSQHE